MFNRKEKPIVVVNVASIENVDDVKKLEEAGYVVIFVHGDPYQAINIPKV